MSTDNFPPGVNDFIDALPSRWYKRAGAETVAQEWFLYNEAGNSIFLPVGKVMASVREKRQLTSEQEKDVIALALRATADLVKPACMLLVSEGWVSKRIIEQGEQVPEGYDDQHYRERLETLFAVAQTRTWTRQVHWPILSGRKLGHKLYDIAGPNEEHGGRFFNLLNPESADKESDKSER